MLIDWAQAAIED